MSDSNKLRPGGTQVLTKKHGVIVHRDSPLVSRASEEEYENSIRLSKEEAHAAQQHNQERARLLSDMQREKKRVQAEREAARRALVGRKLWRRLQANDFPTAEEVHNMYPREATANAIIKLLEERNQLRKG